jgi:uncharacterized membrane protein YphA (DoxX/SURF4 family)
MLVALRLSLGCHFLYEGVWKIKHPEFSAESFLLQAKGPAAPLFHSMVYDIDGRERLAVEMLPDGQALVDRWAKLPSEFAAPYRERLERYEVKRKRLAVNEEQLSSDDQETVRNLRNKINRLAWLEEGSTPLIWEAQDKLEAYLGDHEKAIVGFFRAQNEGDQPDSSDDIKQWLSGIAEIQDEYFAALTALAGEDAEAKKEVARVLGSATAIVDEAGTVDKFIGTGALLDTRGQVIVSVGPGIRAERFYGPWKDLKEKAILANNLADIQVYFESLDRYEAKLAAGNHGAAHQTERLYNEGLEIRAEVNVWLNGLNKADEGYQEALLGLLDETQSRLGELPVPLTQTDLINMAVTYGLTAIGVCLLLGLFTRPAALAGACFMLSIVLSQPAWPTIYPPDLPIVGHALLINKDFVEMVALAALAMTAVGRWGGLDFFVENFILRLFRSGKK